VIHAYDPFHPHRGGISIVDGSRDDVAFDGRIVRKVSRRHIVVGECSRRLMGPNGDQLFFVGKPKAGVYVQWLHAIGCKDSFWSVTPPGCGRAASTAASTAATNDCNTGSTSNSAFLNALDELPETRIAAQRLQLVIMPQGFQVPVTERDRILEVFKRGVAAAR